MRSLLLMIVLGLGASPGLAAGREPADLVPAESLLCWQGQPLPDAPQPGSPTSTLKTLLELGQRLTGQSLEGVAQLTMRGAELFNLMIRYPHAIALVDVKAKPIEQDPRAKRVDKLRLAVIAQVAPSGEQADRAAVEPFLRIIQTAVNEQTNRDEATLVTKTHGRWRYQELRDNRLPDWCVIGWGQIGHHFVLTVGEGVWESVAQVAAGERPALTKVDWFAAARRDRQRGTLIEILVAAREIQARLDPLIDDRASAFFRAWDAEDLRRAYWAIGLEGPALFCRATLLVGDQTVERVYADPAFRDTRLLAVVPDGARWAIYRLPVDRFLQRFFEGIVAMQGPKQQRQVRRIWAEIQQERGFDVERHLLANLGAHVVLHNFPVHPLRVPIAVTTLIEIRENPAQVRRTIDTICEVFREALQQAVAEGHGPLPWALRRTPDGLWHLQFAVIAGPAWTVTDRFVVLSWSPAALRAYLERQGDAVK